MVPIMIERPPEPAQDRFVIPIAVLVVVGTIAFFAELIMRLF